MAPESEALLALAATLSGRLAGVLTHAGHSYAGRSAEEMARIAETERAGVVRAAERLRAAGHEVGIVSLGSSPPRSMAPAWKASRKSAPVSTCSATSSRCRSARMRRRPSR
ncbi:hypothetical protein ACFQU7_12590 [Pseudoroseomonas wenyumeiae]